MDKFKKKRDFKGIFMHGGVFFTGFIICALMTDMLPQRVEVTRGELIKIEEEESKATKEYNELSTKLNEEKETLTKTKNTLDEENKELESRTEQLNKIIEGLKGN